MWPARPGRHRRGRMWPARSGRRRRIACGPPGLAGTAGVACGPPGLAGTAGVTCGPPGLAGTAGSHVARPAWPAPPDRMYPPGLAGKARVLATGLGSMVILSPLATCTGPTSPTRRPEGSTRLGADYSAIFTAFPPGTRENHALASAIAKAVGPKWRNIIPAGLVPISTATRASSWHWA